MSVLRVLSAGPSVSLQDFGRPGFLSQGLSRGGAADLMGLVEGAALLGQPVHNAIEMAGFGGRFVCNTPIRIALTGAPMRATCDGHPLVWNASHSLPAGATLDIGAVTRGVYGYLTVGGGFDAPMVLGAQGAHLAAGIGSGFSAGAEIGLGRDAGFAAGLCLTVEDRFDGGLLRIVPSLQTGLYSQQEQDRFASTVFERDARGNRMGLRLIPDGDGFALLGGQSILSEIIVPGDIQIPGDGSPYILMSECQTTGGYPRIGTVIPADMPRVAQAGPGARLRFAFVDRDTALNAERTARDSMARLPQRVRPLVREAAAADLLSLNLVSGVTTGKET